MIQLIMQAPHGITGVSQIIDLKKYPDTGPHGVTYEREGKRVFVPWQHVCSISQDVEADDAAR